jgi:hypothetical protein
MRQGGFVVAMAATVSIANYERPTEIIRPMKKWTIVSRFGPENEYLTISVTEAMQHGQDEAPIGLTPAKTAFGILLSENERESECMFLLARQLPREIKIAGSFFPAEGYARLNNIRSALHLRTEGRHAHSRGSLNGQDIRIDVPDPAPGAKWAMAWHVDAQRRPWAGEFFASARRAR